MSSNINRSAGMVVQVNANPESGIRNWCMVSMGFNSQDSAFLYLLDSKGQPVSWIKSPVDVGDHIEFEFIQANKGPRVHRVLSHVKPSRTLVAGRVRTFGPRQYGFIIVNVTGKPPMDIFLHQYVLRQYWNYKILPQHKRNIQPKEDDEYLIEVGCRDGRPVVTWIEAINEELYQPIPPQHKVVQSIVWPPPEMEMNNGMSH